MRLISCLIICLGLSACATDYVSQLSESNYGVRSLEFSREDVDPTLLMNGTYASKQLNGISVSNPLGAVCLTDYRCARQAPPSTPGWDP